jgi:predicted AlkP superfamily phosphohydrolase/phosphomutase
VKTGAAKRAWILGIDGMSPKLLDKFIGEGIMPNLAKMAANGGMGKVLPMLPAFTPTNWTTLATGAAPGTHGVFLWGTHRVGEPYEQTYMEESMTSSLCEAEYIWDTAARCGRKSVIMNFVGYPPTKDEVVFVDRLYHPNKCLAEIAGNAYYATAPTDSTVDKIAVQPAAGWLNLPSFRLKPLETTITVTAKNSSGNVAYHGLIYSTTGREYDRLLLSEEKDFRLKFADVAVGEWTAWKFEEFLGNGKSLQGTVRFKLTKLSTDGKQLELYRSQVCYAGDFVVPQELGKELIEHCGPYIGEAVGKAFHPLRWVDETTLKEEFDYQIRWTVRAAKFLMDRTDAQLFALHWHYLDFLQHQFLGLIDPVGSYYDPVKAPEAWQAMRTGYSLADKLVGEFQKIVAADDAVIVVSDHGNMPNRKVLSVHNLLIKEKLLTLDVDPINETVSVDWSKTKVFCHGLHIYINLKGRDPDGIVQTGKEYEELRNKLVQLLQTYQDDDGKSPFLFALKKEDAPLIGLWGEGIGDVVFCYSSGYSWVDEESLIQKDQRVVWTVGGANHGCQPPTAETDISSNYGVMIATGPCIRKDYKRPADILGPISMKDIAPTVASLMNIPAPRHSQGNVLQDIFEGYKLPKRNPISKAPIRDKSKMALRLESDVTDKVR